MHRTYLTAPLGFAALALLGLASTPASANQIVLEGSDATAFHHDGAYTIHGAVEVLGVTKGTVHDWLKKGLIQGKSLGPYMLWRIDLTPEQIRILRQQAEHVRSSGAKASLPHHLVRMTVDTRSQPQRNRHDRQQRQDGGGERQ